MSSLRAFLVHHRRLAMLLVALTLAIKAMIPDGFMPDFGGTTISIRICADATGQALSRQIILPHKSAAPAAKSEGLCAFAALGHAALGGADTVLLVAALLYLLVLGFAPQIPASPRRLTFLRPPLRGPPARA